MSMWNITLVESGIASQKAEDVYDKDVKMCLLALSCLEFRGL